VQGSRCDWGLMGVEENGQSAGLSGVENGSGLRLSVRYFSGRFCGRQGALGHLAPEPISSDSFFRVLGRIPRWEMDSRMWMGTLKVYCQPL
jgi:hypothetical protein